MKFSRLLIVSLTIILMLSVSVFYNHAEPGYRKGEVCWDGNAGMGTYEACKNQCEAYRPLVKEGTLRVLYAAPLGFGAGRCECCGFYKDED